MVRILLLSGYRGAGKDTYLEELLFRKESWCVYGLDEQLMKEYIYIPGTRLSLMDRVKVEVSKALGLPLSPTQIDQLKDQLKVGGRMLREYIYDSIGKTMMKDKYFYEKQIIKDLEDDLYIINDHKMNVTLDYLKEQSIPFATCRVFRGDGPLPPPAEKSEHGLDKLVTDFVLVPKDNHEQEIEKVIQIFPQYKNYKLLYKPE
jgi:hypothetical protein